jgi:hypothetical protein
VAFSVYAEPSGSAFVFLFLVFAVLLCVNVVVNIFASAFVHASETFNLVRRTDWTLGALWRDTRRFVRRSLLSRRESARYLRLFRVVELLERCANQRSLSLGSETRGLAVASLTLRQLRQLCSDVIEPDETNELFKKAQEQRGTVSGKARFLKLFNRQREREEETIGIVVDEMALLDQVKAHVLAQNTAAISSTEDDIAEKRRRQAKSMRKSASPPPSSAKAAASTEGGGGAAHTKSDRVGAAENPDSTTTGTNNDQPGGASYDGGLGAAVESGSDDDDDDDSDDSREEDEADATIRNNEELVKRLLSLSTVVEESIDGVLQRSNVDVATLRNLSDAVAILEHRTQTVLNEIELDTSAARSGRGR